MHGSFAIGLALPAAVVSSEIVAAHLGWTRRFTVLRLGGANQLRLAAATAVSIPLLVINPNGPQLLLYPLSKLNDPLAKNLQEWKSIDFSSGFFWPFALLVLTCAALALARRPRLPASDLAIALVLTAAAIWTRKYVPFAAICLAPVAGRALTASGRWEVRAPAFLQGLLARRRGPSRPELRLVTQLVFLAATTLLLLTLVKIDPTASAATTMPVAAVDTLGAGGLRAPVFSYYTWGGYLLWRLPQSRDFIDGRGDMFISGGEFQSYLDVTRLRPDVDAILDRYGIRTVLFPKNQPLVRHLLAGGWRPDYDDGRTVELQRSP